MRGFCCRPRHKTPVARELAPARLRSSRKPIDTTHLKNDVTEFGAALQPNGSKLPRHKNPCPTYEA
ncbi:hypothetical protein EMIT0194MI4_40187 [Pseudomonas sp. IT-194MI4]